MTYHDASENGTFPTAIAETVKQAVEATFAVICGEKPELLSFGKSDTSATGVIGVISFVGDPTWSMALLVPQETAPALARKFAGFDIPFDSPDMGDAVGELANVLAGDVVARLEMRRIKAQMSLPTVARGQIAETHLPKGLQMTFASAQGPYRFQLTAARPGQVLGRGPGIYS
jgi:CheY-specific phosphatase CheX